MGLGNSRKAAHLLGSPGRKRMKTELNAKNTNDIEKMRPRQDSDEGERNMSVANNPAGKYKRRCSTRGR